MAVEETKIELELEADIYSLKHTKAGGFRLTLGGQKEPVPPQISGCKVKENGDLEILGRALGKVEPSKCKITLGGDEVDSTLESLRAAVGSWYPPGVVEHVFSPNKFAEYKNADTLLVAKFSAEWCGPCKAVAPAIDALSLKYRNVKFIHMDEREMKPFKTFGEEGIRAYPTFKIFKNGNVIEVVQGGDDKKVEQIVKKNGGIAEEDTEAVKPEGTIKFVCKRDALKVVKSSSGISVTINGTVQAKTPRVKINVQKGEVTFGRGGGKIWTEGGYDLAAMASTLEEWFPTKVKHVHSVKEFDEFIAKGITVAKFSADWCGPCKAIEGDYIQMSLDNENVTFLHIDVDDKKKGIDSPAHIASDNGIEAMPTFHFFKDGKRQDGLMVKGASMLKVQASLASLL